MEILTQFLDSMNGAQNASTSELSERENQDLGTDTLNESSGSLAFFEKVANDKIRKYQLVLKDIQVCDELQTFGNLGVFDKGFLNELEWLKDTWIDDDSEELFDVKRVCYIEDRLAALPFETALIHKNKSYRTSSLEEIWNDKFKESAEWRLDPSLVMNMSKEDKLRIYKHFEYMCYFVINTRDELLFDIKDSLTLNDE